ncbi:hypothetical protein QE406_001739 [Microbacterium testaceum]|nr:hypothetical protein [Microbacterium testaceum]MDQ1115730.1 hypothetical protein [Microbacterium testaceum]
MPLVAVPDGRKPLPVTVTVSPWARPLVFETVTVGADATGAAV